MRQLLILSGKGGTGKTTIASAFIHLLSAKVFADCDVDAPNLHLAVSMDIAPSQSDFYGLPKFSIDAEVCVKCDLCRQFCRFGAISNESNYLIDPFSCEGCGLCAAICPVKAITEIPTVSGDLLMYREPDRLFSTARLRMGNGNSGLLVTEVKKQMIKNQPVADLAIIDGSPGIGCPVIASISGVDMVLLVTEPSLSGFSDLKRIIQTVAHFHTSLAVCINKYDIDIQLSDNIQAYCVHNHIDFVGMIPFDSEVIRTINANQPLMDSNSTAAQAIETVFNNTIKLMDI
jgi:MinD superfamily P-loop ATPase